MTSRAVRTGEGSPASARRLPAARRLALTREVLIRDGNPYVPVTAAEAARLRGRWRRAMPVLVTVNGKPDPPWRINLMPAGDGSFYLYLHGTVRKASNTKVGDTVRVEVAFDKHYRNGPQHAMPAWFRSALAKDKLARANWDRLPPSRQKEVLRYFSWLKSDEAKARNVEKALHVLSGKPGRFMARAWKDGA